MPKRRHRAATTTIIKAMQILAVGEPIGDGVANAAILEARIGWRNWTSCCGK